MWATISIIGMLFMQPTDPGKANPRTVVQLQQFSWTEAALEDCIKVSALTNLGLVLQFSFCAASSDLHAMVLPALHGSQSNESGIFID
jgi:hypothetical protein